MKMFTRDMLLNGPPVAVRTWAVEIADLYEEVTGNAVSVWTCVAGGTNGHTTWSMPVEGGATIVDAAMTAFASEAYLAKIEEGRDFFVGSAVDTIRRFYTPAGEDQSAPGSVAVVTAATARAGSLGDAVGWGIETAAYVSDLTGIETSLLGSSAGGFSDLLWLAVAEDAAAADAADEAMHADEGYRKLVARGGPYFVSGTASTRMFLRVG